MTSNDGLYTCFVDISGIQSMYYGQLQDYKDSWETFRRVELYNSNISTIRAGGNTSLTYWQFQSFEDQTLYKQGAQLFAYYIGYSTIVQKN